MSRRRGAIALNRRRSVAFVQTSNTLALGSARTTSSVPVPSGVAVNDIILVHMYLDITTTVTPPSGFTEITFTTTPQTTGTVTRQRVFWKRATGADSGTYAFTHSSASTSAVATRISGCPTSGTPFEVLGSAQNSTSSTTVAAVSGTTTQANELLVYGATASNSGNSYTPPSGFAEITETTQVEVATKSQYVAGATGSFSATASIAAVSTSTLLGLFSS